MDGGAKGHAAHLEAHDVSVVADELRDEVLLAVPPRQHPWLAVAELLRLQSCAS